MLETTHVPIIWCKIDGMTECLTHVIYSIYIIIVLVRWCRWRCCSCCCWIALCRNCSRLFHQPNTMMQWMKIWRITNNNNKKRRSSRSRRKWSRLQLFASHKILPASNFSDVKLMILPSIKWVNEFVKSKLMILLL